MRQVWKLKIMIELNYKLRWVFDYKERQIFKNSITKCNGITKWDKFGIQITMELHSATDYKVMPVDIHFLLLSITHFIWLGALTMIVNTIKNIFLINPGIISYYS